jgi:hypothetical protein
MFQLTSSPGWGRRAVHLVAVMLAVVGAVVILRDPVGISVFFLTVAGAIGGLLLLTVIRRLNRAPDDAAPDAFLRDGLSTDVINFSRIRVTGVGGLCLVAVAFSMAFSLPPVGAAMALGVVGGVLLSFGLLGYRRQRVGRWG